MAASSAVVDIEERLLDLRCQGLRLSVMYEAMCAKYGVDGPTSEPSCRSRRETYEKMIALEDLLQLQKDHQQLQKDHQQLRKDHNCGKGSPTAAEGITHQQLQEDLSSCRRITSGAAGWQWTGYDRKMMCTSLRTWCTNHSPVPPWVQKKETAYLVWNLE
jgi:hypothetical protein